jgi:hypothetical protein
MAILPTQGRTRGHGARDFARAEYLQGRAFAHPTVYSNGDVLWTHLPFGGVGMGSAVVALIFSMAKREVTFRNGTTAIRRL